MGTGTFVSRNRTWLTFLYALGSDGTAQSALKELGRVLDDPGDQFRDRQDIVHHEWMLHAEGFRVTVFWQAVFRASARSLFSVR